MPMIYVKTKPGRKLFYEGKPIPLDSFVPVNDDPYIRRLIDHWGDLEEQGGSDKPKGKVSAGKPGKHTPPMGSQSPSNVSPTMPPTSPNPKSY